MQSFILKGQLGYICMAILFGGRIRYPPYFQLSLYIPEGGNASGKQRIRTVVSKLKWRLFSGEAVLPSANAGTNHVYPLLSLSWIRPSDRNISRQQHLLMITGSIWI